MPENNRHDGFIWALISSLIINALILMVLLFFQREELIPPPRGTMIVSLAQRYGSSEHRLPLPARRVKQGEQERSPLSSQPSTAAEIHREPAKIGPAPALNENSAEDHPHSNQASSQPAEITLSSAQGTNGRAAENSGGGLLFAEDKISKALYTAPERLYGAEPRYPQRAQRLGWEGVVLMSLTINDRGDVIKVELKESSGYALLDRTACDAAALWKYKPARVNGEAISQTINQPTHFQLSHPSSSATTTNSVTDRASVPQTMMEINR